MTDEEDLRAALHRGEGDGPDPDELVSAGRAGAARRRNRLVAVTGTAVAVIAVATTVGVVLGNRHSDPSETASRPGSTFSGAALSKMAPVDGRPALNGGADGSQTGTASAPGGALPGGTPADTTPGSDAACPATFDTSPAGAGGGNDLLPRSAQAVLVCAYGNTGSGDTVHPASTVLVGSNARALIASLNASADAPVPGPCPMYRVAEDHRLTFVPITGDKAGAPVSTTLGNPSCAVVVRGDGDTHYGWSPPAYLQASLFALEPAR